MSKLKDIYRSISSFVSGSYDEMLRKVTWPKYVELQNSAVLVLIAAVIFSVIIGIMDMLFKNGMASIYDSFKN
ncbi:MAG: preprotein translocase subunit SecE [Cytophagaceae bacterium]|nr:preprotein translocase subunit SecE [Cytophagaceae bacterium]MDW8456703.1 preprotein translocase subunit SecE [Cytophagaceae bacterium]